MCILREFDRFSIQLVSPCFQQSGAEEACWAHNPEVGGSKPPSATYTFFKTFWETRISRDFENGACPGVEPGTSRTRSANHTTRPTSPQHS